MKWYVPALLLLSCSAYLHPQAAPSPLHKRVTTPTPIATTTAAWQNAVIYQLLTDRFAKSSDTTSGCSDLNQYCGGTFQGIINHLSYIKGMGFNAIWISPVVQNSAGGYHGYWATNMTNINSNFGSADDLKNLVNAAHSLNMMVMVDIVANHAGIPANSGDYTGYTFNSPSQYHSSCTIDYSSQTSIEQCWLSGLPDINTEDTNIVATLQNIVKYYVTNFGIDGLRVDTVKHIRKTFWSAWVNSAGVFTTGEVLSGDASYVGPYQSVMASLHNYPMYYPLVRTFGQGSPLTQLAAQWTTNFGSGYFSNLDALTNFADNHDLPRFLSINSDTVKLKNALAFTFLTPGIPVMYYGTEQAFNGNGGTTSNREVLWTSGYNTGHYMYTFMQTLITKGRLALGSSTYMNLYSSNNVYAFMRGKALVVVSNYGYGSSAQVSVPLNSQIANGVVLVDIITGITVTTANGYATFNLNSGHPAVFIPK